MSGMTTPFRHPRKELAGIHPKRNEDRCPMKNAGKDEGGDGFPIELPGMTKKLDFY